MNAEPIFDRYYSIHFSRWPLWLFWKQLWRNVPHLAPLLFPILLLQRLPGLKPDPAFASVYPEDISTIDPADIPPRAQNALSSRIREAEELGFRLCFYFALETLGPYAQYDAVLLDASGATTLQIRWYEMQVGKNMQQDADIFCSSTLSAGGSLSSAALAKQNIIPEMRLPDDQQRHYPETTSVEELVRLHGEAIPEQASLQHYDCDSLFTRFRERSKELVDHLLEQRIYFELTPQEIHKLQQQDERNAKKPTSRPGHDPGP